MSCLKELSTKRLTYVKKVNQFIGVNETVTNSGKSQATMERRKTSRMKLGPKTQTFPP